MSASITEITRFFKENGYYHARGLYSPDEVRELEADFDHIVKQLTGSGEEVTGRWGLSPADTFFIHTHNVQMYSAVWLRAFLHRGFLDVAQAILGPDVVLHHSKLFQKPGEKGAAFPMHQDWGYFPTIKDTMIAGIIHVSESTDEMGCLRIYPGSHRLGRMGEKRGQGGGEDFLKDYPIDKALVVEAEPGDVLFFHYFTLHGSMPNRSKKLRKTVLAQLHAGDDSIEEGAQQHPNVRLPLSGWNYHAKRSNTGWLFKSS